MSTEKKERGTLEDITARCQSGLHQLGAELLAETKASKIDSDVFDKAWGRYCDLDDDLGAAIRVIKILRSAIETNPSALTAIRQDIAQRCWLAWQRQQDAFLLATELARGPQAEERKEAGALAREVSDWEYRKWQDLLTSLHPYEDWVLETNITVIETEMISYQVKKDVTIISSAESRYQYAKGLKDRAHALYGVSSEWHKRAWAVADYWHREARGLTRNTASVDESLQAKARRLHADMMRVRESEDTPPEGTLANGTDTE